MYKQTELCRLEGLDIWLLCWLPFWIFWPGIRGRMTCATSEGDDFITMPHLRYPAKKNLWTFPGCYESNLWYSFIAMMMYQNDSKWFKMIKMYESNHPTLTQPFQMQRVSVRCSWALSYFLSAKQRTTSRGLVTGVHHIKWRWKSNSIWQRKNRKIGFMMKVSWSAWLIMRTTQQLFEETTKLAMERSCAKTPRVDVEPATNIVLGTAIANVMG